MTIQEYMKARRRYEISAWLLFYILQTTANVIVVWLDVQRAGTDYQLWELVSWEASSSVLLMLLLPVIIWFDARFPLRIGQLRTHLRRHLLFTVPYSLVHVVGMVAIRKWVYWLHGTRYDFGHVPGELFYEYLKDFRTYFALIGVIYLYRLILSRLQGEAKYISEGEDQSQAADRFLVKKLGKEFLVKVEEIDWVESAGNYVNLHVGKRLYPLRETMANMQRQLADQDFRRVHRSAIVNLDRIAEIEPFGTGEARALLKSGETVPISRRYRGELKERLMSSV